MYNSFNIVSLIENNPITRLSSTYQNKLLNKIKEEFTENEQQMFVTSFYCFLNYSKNDFVIDLDDVWQWIGFSTKQKAKELLLKNFIFNVDYIKSLNLINKQSKHAKGGHNKETFLLNIQTFKKYCLKAGTKKANEIHDYYIKLEETLQNIIQEETNELKLQLEKQTIQLENSEKDKYILRETTLLGQFPKNTQCIYYGIIDDVSDKNEKLVKFGNSNDLKTRVLKHKKTYLNFRLMNTFRVDNKVQIENALKENSVFKERRRDLVIKGKKYVELLNVDGMELKNLDKIIKDIIVSVEYNPENYNKLLDENRMLKKKLEEKISMQNDTNVLVLKEENKRLHVENQKVLKRYNALLRRRKFVDDVENSSSNNEKKEENVNILESLKRITKNRDGKYVIHGIEYDRLFGTRSDVWSGLAYKTTGGLVKNDLLLNKNGKIISKTKFIQETATNRFTMYGVNSTEVPLN